MQLVTYVVKADELNIQTTGELGGRLGWIRGDYVVDAVFAQKWLQQEKEMIFSYHMPHDLLDFMKKESVDIVHLRQIDQWLDDTTFERESVEGEPIAIHIEEAQYLSPIPIPNSVRDFYAFEDHVKTARHRRGLDMIPEWYQLPVFYFSNHRSVVGHEVPIRKPAYTECLDYELEVACIIGKRGKDISRLDAHQYIAGLSILNDWSARDVQRREMTVGLGPAKGKDFATSIGPCMVTLDDLEDRRSGEHWDLEMTAKINGQTLSRGNLKDLHWSFAQMIERASEGVELFPGDIIGSGTVGTGCILELGTEVHRYLEPGDQVELEVERLGVLKNVITK
ncbi:fumarylacetoacetate hydrolase family protein [Hazenella sp. IB182357]|uniref:Fumarylacetoacetate hydrolase family protein n=1 Tax=Polycladospora coralii TaxID=2771432 RepID=A0A926N774_9BACL|nr:fumarylacetoacetate hydrolase family protein [Polycladospora coralii]MBD1373151.1 fumarylacetoacetate hydrolase family protein [Polycladospora coralii]